MSRKVTIAYFFHDPEADQPLIFRSGIWYGDDWPRNVRIIREYFRSHKLAGVNWTIETQTHGSREIGG